MRKKQLYLVLSYGFFLGWLLSFLYNGPALDILFNGKGVNLSFLALSYIIAPAILLLGIGFVNISERYKGVLLFTGIIVCLLGTVGILISGHDSSALMNYSFAVILGIYSVLFIMGWGCYFVEHLNPKNMWKNMALVICLGNIIYALNGILKFYGLNNLIILILFISLLVGILAAVKLSKTPIENNQKFIIDLPRNAMWILGSFMFLLNLGGGVLHTVIEPLTLSKYANIHLLDLFMFSLLLLIIILKKNKLPFEMSLTIGLILIACGYISLILFKSDPLPSYILTVVGYILLDIVIWTIVGELGYLFGKPIRIFAIMMSANLFAVFAGNVLGILLSTTMENIYAAIGITAISTIVAFIFITSIIKLINESIKLRNNKQEQYEARLGVVTDDKAERILTPKELDIYKLMLLGLKNTEIAEQSNISNNTLKEHARKIYKKFGVENKKALLVQKSKTSTQEFISLEVFREHEYLLDLTDREIEVCYYTYLGRTVDEIGHLLFISKNTVKTHMNRFYSKLMITSKEELVEYIEKS